jgi:hypothetical protein
MEVNIREALGISLKEVRAHYFWEGSSPRVVEGLVKQRNWGDVLENHSRSGQYLTEDIDGVPFTAYNSDN